MSVSIIISLNYQPISEHFISAHVNDVLAEHKHKHMKKAYAHVAVVLTGV